MSRASPPSTSEACQTPEYAFQATSQPIPHSASDSRSTTDQFGPTQTGKYTEQHGSFLIAERLHVPSAGCKKFWSQTNEAIKTVISENCPHLHSQEPNSTLHQLGQVVYLFLAKPLSDVQDKKSKRTEKYPSCLKTLRRKLRALRREWRQRRAEPLDETASLRKEFHQTHRAIKRIKRQQQALRESRKLADELSKFRADPYQYGRHVFEAKNAVQPSFTPEEAQDCYSHTFADSNCEFIYSNCPGLSPAPEDRANIPFHLSTFEAFAAMLRSWRNSSAPGPNGILNTIWKRCAL